MLLPFGRESYLPAIVDAVGGTRIDLGETSDRIVVDLDRLPADRGVYLGCFDARSEDQEDADDVSASLVPYRDKLEGRDVIVGPNAGLGLLSQDFAFDKLLHARYVVEKLGREWTWG